MSLAWHAAAFQRTDKMPSLESVMTKRTGPRQQGNPKDMLQTLSARLKIPIRQTRLIRKDAA